ncbi:hypothetical protein O6H91_02G033800 [Diphasiastrum complanatum]|uniref:Uncharacterized protein n=1 Tax=Diphasiastrum complanatum TaxID=34168 RepID=A0ACC2EE77_DIPCM|nr:hypothetical protein O6H91_02G033800 [Diphasiastrum complanatum]
MIASFLAAWPGAKRQQNREGEERVLEHIILDLTDRTKALSNFSDAATQRSYHRKRRLLNHSHSVLVSRLAIMVLVAIMLLITTLLTWFYTSIYATRSVQDLTFVVRQKYLQGSLQSLASILGQALHMSLALNSLHQQIFDNHDFSWPDVEPMVRSINWAIFKSQPHFNSVRFINQQQGHMTDYTRLASSEFLFVTYASSSMSPVICYMQNVTGSSSGSGTGPPTEIRNPSFMVNASEAENLQPEQVVWRIEPDIHGELIISSASALRASATNKYIGFSTVTTTFKALTWRLSSMDCLGGVLLYIWQNGTNGSKIVAHSYQDRGNGFEDPQTASDPVVISAVQFLESKYDPEHVWQKELHEQNVPLTSGKFYIDTMPLNNKEFKDLNLTAVLIVPRKSMMDKYDDRRETAIGVWVGIAVGILLVGCVLICALTSKMSTEMQLRRELIRQLAGKHRAEQSSNHKSQFLANMSHELRTPIAGIIGLLDLLSSGTLTSEQELTISQIHHCAHGLLALVNDVLDISKVEAGNMELEILPFNLVEELETLVDVHVAQSSRSGVDVILDLSDEIPEVLKGDSARIRQIFNNLISNSFKFTESGHILIRGWVDQSLLDTLERSPDLQREELFRMTLKGSGFSFHREKIAGLESYGEENKIVLVFEVEDTGCGIPEEMYESVFDSFVQGDTSMTRSHGGSGLGLYIVRSLVRRMGGEVRIASKQEPGTLVRFHIVLEKENVKVSSKEENSDNMYLNLPCLDNLGELSNPTKISRLLQQPPVCLLERSYALIAMPDGVAKSVAVQWLERKGLKVEHVKLWQEVIPTMEAICKSATTDVKLQVAEWMREKKKGDSINLTDSKLYDMVNPSKCPIIAVIDVSLLPCAHSNSHENIGSFENVDVREPVLIECDDWNSPPPPLMDLLRFLSQIHSKYAITVGWVSPSDFDIRYKQALQAVPASVMIRKPLHGSRMKSLLSMLISVSKSNLPSSVAPSCRSIGQSTPMLLRSGCRSQDESTIDTNNLDAASFDLPSSWKTRPPSCNHHKKNENYNNYEDSAKNASLLFSKSSVTCIAAIKNSNLANVRVAKEKQIDLPHVPNGNAIVMSAANDFFDCSKPQSPTSGLITPQAANSLEDGIQESRKDTVSIKDLENEWRGPVIDLSVSTSISGTQTPISSSPFFSESESTTIASTANSSPLHVAVARGLNQRIGSGSGKLTGMHILLVEDTLVLQRLISTMLKKLGAQVTVVGDGQQAVAAVEEAGKETAQQNITLNLTKKVDFDLILMDCAMPVMDGYNATKAIRKAEVNTSRHIPIVALTAHALACDEEKCLAAGMDAYLTKPINYKLMIKTLQDLVAKPAQ